MPYNIKNEDKVLTLGLDSLLWTINPLLEETFFILLNRETNLVTMNCRPKDKF